MGNLLKKKGQRTQFAFGQKLKVQVVKKTSRLSLISLPQQPGCDGLVKLW